jgi:hypothetical protein
LRSQIFVYLISERSANMQAGVDSFISLFFPGLGCHHRNGVSGIFPAVVGIRSNEAESTKHLDGCPWSIGRRAGSLRWLGTMCAMSS